MRLTLDLAFLLALPLALALILLLTASFGLARDFTLILRFLFTVFKAPPANCVDIFFVNFFKMSLNVSKSNLFLNIVKLKTLRITLHQLTIVQFTLTVHRHSFPIVILTI